MRKRDEDKQRRIKEALIEIVLKEGFGSASVAKIARRADVSPATVYVYYENKEDMLRSVLAETSRALYERLAQSVGTVSTGEAAVDALVRTYYAFMRDHVKEYSFIEQFASCPHRACAYADANNVGPVMKVLDDLKSRGLLADLDDLVLFGLLFNPVKALLAFSVSEDNAPDGMASEADSERLLNEVIAATQRAVAR